MIAVAAPLGSASLCFVVSCCYLNEWEWPAGAGHAVKHLVSSSYFSRSHVSNCSVCPIKVTAYSVTKKHFLHFCQIKSPLTFFYYTLFYYTLWKFYFNVKLRESSVEWWEVKTGSVRVVLMDCGASALPLMASVETSAGKPATPCDKTGFTGLILCDFISNQIKNLNVGPTPSWCVYNI